MWGYGYYPLPWQFTDPVMMYTYAAYFVDSFGADSMDGLPSSANDSGGSVAAVPTASANVTERSVERGDVRIHLVDKDGELIEGACFRLEGANAAESENVIFACDNDKTDKDHSAGSIVVSVFVGFL